jgi:peroxiredoxin
VKGWAAHTLGGAGSHAWVQALAALVLLAVLLWALPSRRAGEEGGHHAVHAPVADPFERAGVTELTEGQRGPAFRLARLDGGWATQDTWKGRLVVLNFWATWCTPCTVEMPTLEALWREYRDRGLVVVGVSVDRGAPRALIEPYVRNLGLTFPILLDPDMRTADAWRVRGLPATFVVRPGGEVAGMALGAREWNSAEMKALIESLLPGGPGH